MPHTAAHSRYLDISRIESTLGYPSSSPATPAFSLPSLAEINLPRPEAGAGAVRPVRKLNEYEGPTKVLIQVEQEVQRSASSSKVCAGAGDGAKPPEPSGDDTLRPEASDSLATFSTWLPDDSLRFINPTLLSDAEKRTLKDLPAPPQAAEEVAEKETRAGFDDRQEPPTRTSRPAPPTWSSGTRSLPSTNFSISYSAKRRPSMPDRVKSAIETETNWDLLRQVKSNNLTLPSSSSSTEVPPAFQPLPPPPPPTQQEQQPRLPFTRVPLVHPPLSAARDTPHPRPPLPPERTYFPSVLEPVDHTIRDRDTPTHVHPRAPTPPERMYFQPVLEPAAREKPIHIRPRIFTPPERTYFQPALEAVDRTDWDRHSPDHIHPRGPTPPERTYFQPVLEPTARDTPKRVLGRPRVPPERTYFRPVEPEAYGAWEPYDESD